MAIKECEAKPIPAIYSQFSPDELKIIADNGFKTAGTETDPLMILGCLQVTADALRAGKLTLESVGLEMPKIISMANRAYSGSSEEATAIHSIASNILSSFPQARK
jgi:hypothetical protein